MFQIVNHSTDQVSKTTQERPHLVLQTRNLAIETNWLVQSQLRKIILF